MVPHLPQSLPPLSSLLDDLHLSSPRQIGALFQVTPTTATRWKITGHASRAVQLALYWPSQWGRTDLACDAYNERQIQRHQIRALSHENEQLRATVARLLASGNFGAANDAGVSGFAGPGSIRFAYSTLTGFALPGNDP